MDDQMNNGMEEQEEKKEGMPMEDGDMGEKPMDGGDMPADEDKKDGEGEEANKQW